MKRFLALAAIAFVLAIGTGAVITLHSQPAYADCTNNNC
jgi:hypothetical protein